VQPLSAAVDAHGAFALRVPKGTDHVQLDIEARFLALDEKVEARPGERAVELRPTVRAIVTGRVLPPLGVGPEAQGELMPGVRVVLVNPADTGVAATLADDGSFVLTHVPADVPLELGVENPWGPELRQIVDALAPAERRSVVLTLELGIIIAGRVIDEHGLPVVGEEVQAVEQASPRLRTLSTGSDAVRVKTDAEGRFEFPDLARRSWKVTAQVWDSARDATAFVDGTAGDARDLVLDIVRGGCIEGTVEWPDRRPVESFRVSASERGHTFNTQGAGGRFRICGLADGVYDIEARAPAAGGEGHARVTGVRPGDSGTRLVLQSRTLFTVRGTVSDRSGRPASGVHASPTFQGIGPASRPTAEWSSYEGGFTMTLGCAGEWKIRVSASGLRSAEQIVLVGPDTEPVRFVLDAAGRIRGRVVDPGGDPVAGAMVGRMGVQPVPRALAGQAPGDKAVSVFDQGALTDVDGRFEFAATSSPLSIHAVCEGYAPSALVEVSAASDETVEGLVLSLRTTCRVEGRVLDCEGRPLPGAFVYAEADGATGSAETDARGEFVIDGLPSAVATLWARPSFFSPELARAEVALAADHGTSVELRFEKPDPVRVRGRLVRAGVPIAGWIQFQSRSYSASASAGTDGAFEVELPRPGPCSGSISLRRTGIDAAIERHGFEITVPDADAHELMLDVDTLPVVPSPVAGY
jgi:carboxypeptidase family protein